MDKDNDRYSPESRLVDITDDDVNYDVSGDRGTGRTRDPGMGPGAGMDAGDVDPGAGTTTTSVRSEEVRQQAQGLTHSDEDRSSKVTHTEGVRRSSRVRFSPDFYDKRDAS